MSYLLQVFKEFRSKYPEISERDADKLLRRLFKDGPEADLLLASIEDDLGIDEVDMAETKPEIFGNIKMEVRKTKPDPTMYCLPYLDNGGCSQKGKDGKWHTMPRIFRFLPRER